MSRVRAAVLVSGAGTTLQNLLDRIADGRLDADIELVVSSDPGATALARAASRGIATDAVTWSGDIGAASFHDEITRLVDAADVDLVCLCGFLRRWVFPEHWAGRVLNIHPALLPAFGGAGMFGAHVHEAVIASGAKVSGCTVHFATHDFDAGPIILQRTVPVYFEDTPQDLARRVFAEECEAYPSAIRLFGSGRLEIVGDRVKILPAP